MADELKPCPLCGESDQEVLLIQHLEGTIKRPAYRVCCDNCGASSPYDDRGNHIAIWNTRATTIQDALALPEIAALVTALRAMKSAHETGNDCEAAYDDARAALAQIGGAQ